MAGVTGRQGMLTPPRHLIPSLVHPEVLVCPILKRIFLAGLMRLMTVRYLHYFIVNIAIWIKIKQHVKTKPVRLKVIS
jgi:hypothetical protein